MQNHCLPIISLPINRIADKRVKSSIDVQINKMSLNFYARKIESCKIYFWFFLTCANTADCSAYLGHVTFSVPKKYLYIKSGAHD